MSALLATLLLAGCRQDPTPTSSIEREPASSTSGTTRSEVEVPDRHLIRFACAGFDAAVAADAPPDRLLSRSAAHAIELGGAPVERATQRWALLPPQGLLEEIERYERESDASPDECAGLRAHLERMAILSSTH